ncbi:HIRAN domain-containing protein [Brucella lupini]|uniref:Uncharacterized protein n=1 Tax=Brucella lupini TaxID=255457 RepID=A0A256GC50_9HYPH|nr:HIRAN domain-containing protein [Brucella lupini]KAB2706472.1 hypothetical protein F9L03_02040 [Brucella lupini]OYR24673.1 hypothetical protein CES86_4962 [Brucella lupini]
MDWLGTLKAKGDFAKRIAAQTVEALKHPNLTIDQGNRLYKLVVKGSEEFDQFVEKLDAADLDEDVYDGLIEVAETIEDIWSDLIIGVAEQLRGKGIKLDHATPDHDRDEKHNELAALAAKNGLELLASDVLVMGTGTRADNVADFGRAIVKSQKSDDELDDIGIQLIREPENEVDEYAIKIYGCWKEIGRSVNRHIGYVPKKLAYKIGMNNSDDTLVGLLSSMNNNDDDGFDIKIHILARG